jgi:NAD(P)-dependent dehydrogenase (short-subunit alcohol dehydrogenase family)
MTAMPAELPYVTTKAAIEGLTLTLSAALASKRITVNAVDPGATDTGWISEHLHAELVGQAPFGRIGLPDDAARLIGFLVRTKDSGSQAKSSDRAAAHNWRLNDVFTLLGFPSLPPSVGCQAVTPLVQSCSTGASAWHS